MIFLFNRTLKKIDLLSKKNHFRIDPRLNISKRPGSIGPGVDLSIEQCFAVKMVFYIVC